MHCMSPYKNLRITSETFDKLKKHKGSNTWDELLNAWVGYFEGFGDEDVIKYVTHGDWKEVEKLKAEVERLTNIINNKK